MTACEIRHITALGKPSVPCVQPAVDHVLVAGCGTAGVRPKTASLHVCLSDAVRLLDRGNGDGTPSKAMIGVESHTLTAACSQPDAVWGLAGCFTSTSSPLFKVWRKDEA